MHAPNLIHPFVQRLEDLRVQYMITGSVAGIIYGEPRVTHDVDLVVTASDIVPAAWVTAFPLDEFYCPPEEVITVEARRKQRGHFNVIHHESGYKADIYIAFDELHRWALGKRRRLSLGSIETWVAPPEYVIIRKLQYFAEGGAEKHLTDIRSILELSGDDIDQEEINCRTKSLGLENVWSRAQDSN